MSERNFETFLENLRRVQAEGQDLVVVTLVNVQGAAPQEVGAKIIVSARGLEYGTVGGGKVEQRAVAEAQGLLLDVGSSSHFTQWNLQTDVGMSCGGVVNFFFEVLRLSSPWSVVVFGAGHIAQELVPLLTKLSCQVYCIDPRTEWLGKILPATNLKTICTEDMQAEVDKLPDQSFVVISTMGHGFDFPILLKAMKQRQRFRYVGNIGSEQKAKKLRHELELAGIEKVRLNDFYCPIGENFGKSIPVEIALSIVAQILRVRDAI
jgi:xanthine dehydrogenase accessory factor